MLVLVVLAFLRAASASTSSDIVLVCTKDALYSSLYRSGRQFCSSVLGEPPCEAVTPTAYVTCDPAVISSRCSCVLANKCRPRPTGSSTVSSTWSSYLRPNSSRSDYATSTASGGTSSTEFTSSYVVTSGSNWTTVDASSTALYTSSSVSTSYRYANSSSSRLYSSTAGSSSPTATASSVRSEITSSLQSTPGSLSSGASPTYPFNSSTGSVTNSTGTPSSSSQSSSENGTSSEAASISSTSSSVTDLRPLPTITLTPVPSANISTVHWTLPGPGSSSISPDTSSTTNNTASASSPMYGSTLSSISSETSSPPAPTTTTSTTHAETPSKLSTSTYLSTSTSPPPVPSLSVANFTQVTRTAAVAEQTCYQFPQDADAENKHRRATLHNDEVWKHNNTPPAPYIESVFFDSEGVHPVFLTLRDASNGTYYMDVSNKSHLSVTDTQKNTMLIDAHGIHFSTNTCAYDVSITIDDMYEQLESLSGEVCSKVISSKRLVEESSFEQVLFLKDQCGNGIRRALRKYPALRVGDSDCVDTEVDSSTGKWTFLCPFPGSDSAGSRCRASVDKDVVRFLLADPFGGACPDLSTVVTTLAATGRDFLSELSLREALYKLSLGETQREEADATVGKYGQLWNVFRQALSKSRAGTLGQGSAMEQYVNTYNKYRSFGGDICNDLHAGDLPLNMSLQAGVTYIDSITSLEAAPENPKPFNVTVQDSTQVACCKNGSKSWFNRPSGTCSYPANATVGDSGCVCGQTSGGDDVAFEYMECANFVSQCTSDDDCASAGYNMYKCLTGSCCGSGVCFDPYACSQKGVKLV